MTDQVKVHIGELKTHADHLHTAADHVREAATDAAAIDLHDGAFGKMMAWLPGRINKLAPSNADAIKSAAGSIERTSKAVDRLADDFKGTDADIAARLDKIAG